MTYELAKHFPHEIIFQTEGPMITLYQPTHRRFPENKQDPIVFKNLLRDIDNSLSSKYDKEVVSTIMAPFYELEEDADFWNNTQDGIAVLGNQSQCVIYHLQETVNEYATVANSFHIKPLIKAFQSLENYQLLGLSRNSFSIYQGNRNRITEIEKPANTPTSLEDVLGEQKTESYLSHGSYGGASGKTMYHGHGDTKQETDIDTEKYFRYVDKFVSENYSSHSKLPLILVALGEYHSDFKNKSINPYLHEEGVTKSYESMDLDEIKEEVLEIIKPIHEAKIQELIDTFKQAESGSLGSSKVAKIASAAFDGRIDTVLIEENKIVGGKIDMETGEVKFGSVDSLDLDDILDDIAELVLMRKGEVFILPKDKMPSDTGVCAIFRY
jgi:hypothetical protein